MNSRARRRSLILGGAIMYLFLLDVSTRSLSLPCPIASRYIHRANWGQIFGFSARSLSNRTLGGGGLESETEEKERIDFSQKKTLR